MAELEFRGKVYEVETDEFFGTHHVKIDAETWTMGKGSTEAEAMRKFHAAIAPAQKEWEEAHPHWGERPDGLEFEGDVIRECERCGQGQVRRTNAHLKVCNHCFTAWDYGVPARGVPWSRLARWAANPDDALKSEAMGEFVNSLY
jgi:hypothetical protein